MGMMLAYGAYLGRGTSLVRSALVVCGGILVVSLLATCLVFPLVFHYHMDPAQGPDLVFEYRPLRLIPGFESRDIFSCIDYVASDWLLPVGACITSLFVGWFAKASIVIEELSEAGRLSRSVCLFLLRFVCPIAIAVVFASNALAGQQS